MIVIVRRRNIALIVLIFLLAVMVYSLNVVLGESVPVTGTQVIKHMVILDPGHGGVDPGAVSGYSGILEKDINLNIALSVKRQLEAENYKVLMTRSEDILNYDDENVGYTKKRYQDLVKRKKLMDEGGAEIVVSIHMNKIPETQYYGAQAFFPPDSADSRNLAVTIQKKLKEMVDPNNKRQALVKKPNPRQIIILQDLKTPTAVIECGFLSNVEEEKKLSTPEYQEKLASAIKSGIIGYFDSRK